jgi:NAD(P)-dependent dehydrogenase (short-subunit alcohol dehydrogenase family)
VTGDFDGLVAAVTGGASGIGAAVVAELAAQGARVAVLDLQEPAEDAPHALAIRTDVSDDASVRAAIERVVAELGRLDVLVNNAGILRDKTLLKMEFKNWQAVLDVHLTGTFLCMRAAAHPMKEQGSGRIINTTSISGLLGNFGQANYSAAKAGIYGLTRTASIELQRYGILVNAVAPIAKTRMTEDLPMFEKIEATLSPEHVAPVHLFLASDLLGERTGIVIGVAGARLSIFKMVESAGRFKESDDGVWTAQEIAENFDAISR